jgi:hypothetical protein
MNTGSRSIPKLITAIQRLGPGAQISYGKLLVESGIAEANTLAKAIREARKQRVLKVKSGHGRVANRYWILKEFPAFNFAAKDGF